MLDMSCRPSALLDINDPYTAFCFDEACAYIIKRAMDGENPIIKNKIIKEHKEYSKPSDLYNKILNK